MSGSISKGGGDAKADRFKKVRAPQKKIDAPTAGERFDGGALATPAAPRPEGAMAVGAAERPKPLQPGSVIGVLGGGQLGKMLCMAAARLGFSTHVYAPVGEAPATSVATQATRGSEDYLRGLERFAEECDIVTYEFENVPLDAVDAAARITPVRPGRRALEAAQDRVTEKTFLRSIGLETAPFFAVSDSTEVARALIELKGDAILKTRRMGYDGRGQARLRVERASEAAAAAEAALGVIGRAPAILEGRVDFLRELSVVAARGVDGAVRAYDPAENEHERGVLRRSVAPGAISAATAAEARSIAEKILTALDYVGVIGVELFEAHDGRLLVNEIAPRVHNTGHWTLEACAVSQFEQHIRAVAGWPLGSTARHADAEMTNLLGDEAADWLSIAAEEGAALHLYGKAAARPGRKMGHVTRLKPLTGRL